MKHIHFGSTESLIDGQSNISLESIEQRVAVESGVFNSIVNSIVDVVPALVHATRKHFGVKDLDKWDLRFLDVPHAILERTLLSANYMDIGEIACNMPPAVSGTMNAYVKSLMGCTTYANDVLPKLTDYAAYLSRILSNSDERRSLRDYSLTAKENDKQRQVVSAEHDAMLVTGSNRTIARYREIASSNADFLQVQVNMVSLLKTAGEVKVKSVQAMVAQVVELLKALEEASQNKQINDLSPEAFRTLSTLTAVMARDVEFYSITLYRIFQVKVAYETSAKTLIKSLR